MVHHRVVAFVELTLPEVVDEIIGTQVFDEVLAHSLIGEHRQASYRQRAQKRKSCDEVDFLKVGTVLVHKGSQCPVQIGSLRDFLQRQSWIQRVPVRATSFLSPTFGLDAGKQELKTRRRWNRSLIEFQSEVQLAQESVRGIGLKDDAKQAAKGLANIGTGKRKKRISRIHEGAPKRVYQV